MQSLQEEQERLPLEAPGHLLQVEPEHLLRLVHLQRLEQWKLRIQHHHMLMFGMNSYETCSANVVKLCRLCRKNGCCWHRTLEFHRKLPVSRRLELSSRRKRF
ncbi:MAG: hypothetical protein GY903_21845 [Fuerstiella sp.]|nr:hypothetical protein [Fuerstiella sp.]MCP4783851.1 hypothetical protein [Fuerstiella sp.]MCP4857134.1 hypothetical protein [Fuerstiella sp.]